MPVGLQQDRSSGPLIRSTPTRSPGFSVLAGAWITARPTAPRSAAWSPTKQMIITKEHDASVETIIYYNDLKAYGKGFWSFYRKARKSRGPGMSGPDPTMSLKFRKPRTSSYVTRIWRQGELKKEEVELLVLSTGLIAERQKRTARQGAQDPARQAWIFQGEGSVYGSAGNRCAGNLSVRRSDRADRHFRVGCSGHGRKHESRPEEIREGHG